MSSQASLLTPSIRRFIGSWAASLESWDTASVSYGLRYASRMKQEGGLTRRDSLAARLTVIGMRDRREVSSEHPVTPVCASAHKRRHATRAPRHVVSSAVQPAGTIKHAVVCQVLQCSCMHGVGLTSVAV